VNKLELLTRVKSLLRVSLLKRKLDQVLALEHPASIAPPSDRDSRSGAKLERDEDEPPATGPPAT